MTRQRMLKSTVALVFGLAGCGDSITNHNDNDILLTVGCSIFQPNLNSTLLEAKVLIDGEVVGTEQSAPATVLLPTGQKANVKKGAYTVGCRVVSQTASPTVYEISALVNATRPSGGDQDINLGPLTKSLVTGETFTFNITVNP